MPEALTEKTKPEVHYEETISLLVELLKIPAPSGSEGLRAELITDYLRLKGLKGICRKKNNVWISNLHYNPQKPTILLNSHLDTVLPNKGYKRDPFMPQVEDGKLYGLGSNDAGGSLVSLLTAFLHFYPADNLKYNLIYSATAEEEISGKNGIELIYNDLGSIDFAIVGEPTQMDIAIAEKGLLVIDCIAKGKAGHAARDIGENAIYKAMEDIRWISSFEFPEISETLGKVKMSVTVIEGGKQHNIIPDSCSYTIDVRLTEKYTHQEILDLLSSSLKSEIKPRSLRLKPSCIPANHPVIRAAEQIGCNLFGSETTSDQALIPAPSIKMGPGNSHRSHTADEFIFLDELRDGINKYIKLLELIL